MQITDETLEKAQALAQLNLEVFDDFWNKTNEFTDETKIFVLWKYDLTFNIAFGICYGHIEELTERGIDMIWQVYDEAFNLGYIL